MTDSAASHSGNEPAGLQRSLGLAALTFYGVGDILGAGIYALVGAVAGIAGSSGWLSFLVAMAVALLTGLAYAELGGRYPHSGGESFFCQHAFRSETAGFLIGWLVFCSGVVSLATVSRACAGYFAALAPPGWNPPLIGIEAAVIVVVLCSLAAINFWGMRQSSAVNIVFTCIEAGGLLAIIGAGLWYLGGEPAVEVAAAPADWSAVARGGALAFFAFIGFEDMVNVAEEVKHPRRNLPLAILAAALISGTMYIAVSCVATSVIAPRDLAQSTAPLTDVIRTAAPATPKWLFTFIALFAIANTGLLNFIMTSRLLYGMSRQQLLPAWLAAIHPTRHTPYRTILIVLLIAAVLSLSGTLAYLAETTSLLILIVFGTVNLSLIVIRRRDKAAAGFRVPLIVPACGAASCVLLALFMKPVVFYTAAAALGLGLLLAAIRHGTRADRA